MPLIVQHSFGAPGSGGPIGALERLMSSSLSERYTFVRLHQDGANGAIDVRRLREWRSRLRDIQPDLVHVRGLGNEGFHGVLAARMARCPRVLVSVHGTVRDLQSASTIKRTVLTKALEPATLAMASHITTVCEFAAERPFIARHTAKLVGPMINGVQRRENDAAARAQVREELGLGSTDTAILSVGRLSVEKGHRDLARALADLAPPQLEQVVLVLVGDGPDKSEILARYAAVEGLRVRALGQRLDVSRLLQGGDIFAFPSWHENLSNALLEAMAAGLPVVATRVGGNTEVLLKGGGLLVPAHDPKAVATAIGSLIDSPEVRARLGAEARSVVGANYSMERMVEVMDEIYQSVLSR